ncbi:MAG: UDP-2,3-diacylglucosamine diphosphatase [Cellvibrionaceae bacterium]
MKYSAAMKSETTSAPLPSASSANDSSDTSHSISKQVTTDIDNHHRSIWISDVHLGTKDCRADLLIEFLKQHRCDRLYLVGDIIDGWKMKSGIHWKKSYTRLVRRILKIAKQGTTVYYITGNHDEFLRKYANSHLDNIHLVNRFDHMTADNRRLLIIHGDQFDGVTRCSKWLRHVGDIGYEILMFMNRHYNRWRAKTNKGYWSLAGFLKQHIRRAKTYIHDYEHAVVYSCKKQNYDGVVCGHIHHAASKKIDGLDYYNTGDWVESCTALVEDKQGKMTLIHWLDERPKTLNKRHSKKTRKRTKNQKQAQTQAA